MRVNRFHMGLVAILLQIVIAGTHQVKAQLEVTTATLDARVKAFLDRARHEWREQNVPFEDGQILHDLVVQNGFKNVLEIGTSTGHSTIWLAWAASKTGGRVITIDIDSNRHKKALENFRKAGVDQYIDARLADAHELVKALSGPFDFVFSDADKEWYLQYFKDLDPKIRVNGCFVAHNVLRSWAPQVEEFLAYVKARPNYRTRIEKGSGEGISISCKTAEYPPCKT
jgi:caffeoyl-CoA O-methyltransferase